MPLLILLDNSLSMCKLINNSSSKKDISHLIIESIIEELNKRENKYDYVSLLTFSSNTEIICEFTREYSKINECLKKIKTGSYACIEQALNFVSNYVIDEWSSFTNIEILMITDGLDNLNNDSSLKQFCNKLDINIKNVEKMCNSKGLYYEQFSDYYKNHLLIENSKIFDENYSRWKYPFPFSNRFDIICLNSNENDKFDYGYLNNLLLLNNSFGKLYVTNKLRMDYIKNEFMDTIINSIINEFRCSMICGSFESNIMLIPKPLPFKFHKNNSNVEIEINKRIYINGFINISEFVTPYTLSRHLVIPINTNNIPTFTMLLHESLKSENMAAIVSLGDDWFAVLYCWVDTKSEPKKKTSLMLSIFPPGVEILQNSSIKVNINPLINQIQKQIDTKSYAKNCIVWLKQNSLVSDMQKIVRNAKKMPEKMPIFYKELNRVRRAALSFGFYELFDGLAQLLQRELTNNLNEETTLHLQHVINALKLKEHKEYKNDIYRLSIKK